MKRNEKGSRKSSWWQFPKDQGPLSKQKKETWKCQREEKQEWKNNEKTYPRKMFQACFPYFFHSNQHGMGEEPVRDRWG